jgi:spore coat polysaccharide biosynthesis protein SpsF
VNIGTVIQARMGSSRLPGKVLYEVNGKVLLQYVIERVRRSKYADCLVVATSCEPQDNAIADFCRRFGVEFYRGALNDVAGRFAEVLEKYGFDVFVRICGDSPLIDQTLIDKACDIFLQGDFDIVTNTLHRTYPRGQSVEVVRAEVFERARRLMTEDEDKEHVTRFFYRNADRFDIHNFCSDRDRGFIQLSVDNPTDMELFAKVVSQMDRAHWEYRVGELIELYQSVKGGLGVAAS